MQPHRIIHEGVLALACVGLLGLWGSGANAQLTDQTQTPNTASNLDPGNPSDSNFPQSGHGSIKLGVLFTTPGPE